jgi:hypothetical protein
VNFNGRESTLPGGAENQPTPAGSPVEGPRDGEGTPSRDAAAPDDAGNEHGAETVGRVAPAGELPDNLRIPLHSLQADVGYLFGRVAADGSVASMMASSVLERLSLIETAALRLANPKRTRPECPYCGADEGLRVKCAGYGDVAPEYTCEACFTGSDDGPCFDDLNLA